MARLNLRSGDEGDLPVTFQGDSIQQAITFRNAGTITVTPTACHLYVYVDGVEVTKVVNGSTRAMAVVQSQTYDVMVAGTTTAQPIGSIHYRFD